MKRFGHRYHPRCRRFNTPITVMGKQGLHVLFAMARMPSDGLFPTLVHWYANGTESTRDLRDEGITWIRGHHAEDSPENQALQAAAALVRRVVNS